VLAGPFTNLLLAVAILAGFTLAYGKVVVPPVVGLIQQGSAADKAGVKLGDKVVSLRGSAVTSFIDVRMAVAQFPGEALDLVVERQGQRVSLPAIAGTKEVTDRFGNTQRIGYFGIGPASAERVQVGPIEAVGDAVIQTRDIMGMMITGIEQIITGKREIKELGGPIKIAKYSGEQLVSGWANYVWFIALISINLGFINLLPIPVLDGGHLAFYAIEAVRRKPVSQRGQEWAVRTGMALVLALMLFVTFNDVASLKFFGGGG
jgi:regulator of sigma E protease